MKASIENALDGECWKGQGEQLDQACHNLRILAFEHAVFEQQAYDNLWHGHQGEGGR